MSPLLFPNSWFDTYTRQKFSPFFERIRKHLPKDGNNILIDLPAINKWETEFMRAISHLLKDIVEFANEVNTPCPAIHFDQLREAGLSDNFLSLDTEPDSECESEFEDKSKADEDEKENQPQNESVVFPSFTFQAQVKVQNLSSTPASASVPVPIPLPIPLSIPTALMGDDNPKSVQVTFSVSSDTPRRVTRSTLTSTKVERGAASTSSQTFQSEVNTTDGTFDESSTLKPADVPTNNLSLESSSSSETNSSFEHLDFEDENEDTNTTSESSEQSSQSHHGSRPRNGDAPTITDTRSNSFSESKINASSMTVDESSILTLTQKIVGRAMVEYDPDVVQTLVPWNETRELADIPEETSQLDTSTMQSNVSQHSHIQPMVQFFNSLSRSEIIKIRRSMPKNNSLLDDIPETTEADYEGRCNDPGFRKKRTSKSDSATEFNKTG